MFYVGLALLFLAGGVFAIHGATSILAGSWLCRAAGRLGLEQVREESANLVEGYWKGQLVRLRWVEEPPPRAGRAPPRREVADSTDWLAQRRRPSLLEFFADAADEHDWDRALEVLVAVGCHSRIQTLLSTCPETHGVFEQARRTFDGLFELLLARSPFTHLEIRCGFYGLALDVSLDELMYLNEDRAIRMHLDRMTEVVQALDGPDLEERLAKRAVEARNPSIRRWALRALSEVSETGSLSQSVASRLTQDPDLFVRVEAVAQMGAIESLLAMAEQHDLPDSVRTEALRHAVTRGAPLGVARVVALLRDAGPRLRAGVAKALGTAPFVGSTVAEAALLEILSDRTEMPLMTKIVATSLVEIGGMASLRRLAEIAGEELRDNSVRSEARRALEALRLRLLPPGHEGGTLALVEATEMQGGQLSVADEGRLSVLDEHNG